MDSTINTRVIVIADRSFGARLHEVANDSHTWIIDTPTNRAHVQEIWERHKSQPDLYKSLTLYNDHPSLPLEEIVAGMIGTIEEHHPGQEYGFGGVEFQTGGFIVSR